MTSSDGVEVNRLREKLKPPSFLFCALLYVSTERVLLGSKTVHKRYSRP